MTSTEFEATLNILEGLYLSINTIANPKLYEICGQALTVADLFPMIVGDT